ncbi:methionine synthase (B12-independent) [Humidesulfovibrio mexicanus]|uniref:5-methyltetrahydropteroyltriglutamate--homocysteine methyltransferase n=1 Tax=Humidesulfovibrio mexicanus TaxID=147047 RepID=A0A239BQV0_9BACT|nr:5-methyltetrahydropteroyltriglutamate--homocysteine S-methyltransferase [Humidesulfovibrio mexicanus]SNS10435.1 methionine synthase (B12-independent) [Humidesulfovibrio mexicanus]
MLTHTLGFPRMGRARELKTALEAFWAGTSSRAALLETARSLRLRHWTAQVQAGVDIVPVGDFSLYDHMLDMTVRLGVAPQRFRQDGQPPMPDDLDAFFRMARGGEGVAALEMTKWFDTNYHYLVPELERGQVFRPDASGLLEQLAEAHDAGLRAKVVLPGPCTFLHLAKSVGPDFDRFELLPELTQAYVELVQALADPKRGAAEWIQLDEPVLALDLPQALPRRFRTAIETLARAARPARFMLTTCFGSMAQNVDVVSGLELDALHLDLVRAPEQLDGVFAHLAPGTSLSLGVVDGRNVWRVDARKALALLSRAVERLGVERVLVAPSCSLLHCPLDLGDETLLDPELRGWMAFALQKCEELRRLADCAAGLEHSGKASCADWLAENARAQAGRAASPRLQDPEVRRRMAAATPEMLFRALPYPERAALQRQRLGLPLLPTTTIGSFPQTRELRQARARFKRGELPLQAYEEAMREAIRDVVARQEGLGLDVLVHGEPERNDMVEHFGERLSGFCFTQNGWVQSYGSRCVKPPVIFGDVSRPAPMTVAWARFAQSLTDKPMKGMLTGPVTILCWSFVRDDQPRAETCRQIALALRDEVADLEAAGIRVIQIDEPALREGLPLRTREHDAYLRWAVDAFRLAVGAAAPETQIHTHMCYCEFNDIVEWIAALDADVISIEASRSRMELLDAFRRFQYPNEIGPGVWDIHSPRVPGADEMLDLLRRAAAVIPVERLWVNPDCGLKTRAWPETMASLDNMVQAARKARKELVPA